MVVCLYYSVQMLIGSDILPTNTMMSIFSGSGILLGALIAAIMFGYMVDLVQTLNRRFTIFQANMDKANNTMKNLQLEEDLQDNVIQFIRKTFVRLDSQSQF